MGSIIFFSAAWRQIIFVDECLTLTKDIRSKVKFVGVMKSDETEAVIMECCCVRSPSMFSRYVSWYNIVHTGVPLSN